MLVEFLKLYAEDIFGSTSKTGEVGAESRGKDWNSTRAGQYLESLDLNFFLY